LELRCLNKKENEPLKQTNDCVLGDWNMNSNQAIKTGNEAISQNGGEGNTKVFQKGGGAPVGLGKRGVSMEGGSKIDLTGGEGYQAKEKRRSF